MSSACCKLFLNYFFYMLQFLGLFFPVEVDEVILYSDNFWILKRIYAVFISLLLISSFVFLQWLEIQTVYKVTRTSIIILTVLTHACFTIICVLCCLGTVFWHKGRFGHYLKLQRILRSKMNTRLTRNSVYLPLELILGQVILIAMASLDLLRYFEFEMYRLHQVLSVTLKQLLLYYCFLITILIYSDILRLKNYFRTLRIFLANTVGLQENYARFALYRSAQEGQAVTFPIAVVGSKTLLELTEASKILNILFECMDIFNQIFGLVLVFINGLTVLAILLALNTLLVFGENNQLSTTLVVCCICEAIVLLVWSSFLLTASGLLKEESCEIVTMCCKLQHLLPQASQERKELLNIAHQVRRKSPAVSASGFYDVDFYLILALFTYVGTYTVVLIQFSHMDF